MANVQDDLPQRAPAGDDDEPVFDEPWQARIFAIVRAMHQDGRYAWREFQLLLIDEIGSRGAEDGSDYYERWLAAAERLVIARGMSRADELAALRAHLASHPPHPTKASPGPMAVEPARR